MILSNELIQINPCADFETGLFSGDKPVIQVKNYIPKQINITAQIQIKKSGNQYEVTLLSNIGRLRKEELKHYVYTCGCTDKMAHVSDVTQDGFTEMYDGDDVLEKEVSYGTSFTFTHKGSPKDPNKTSGISKPIDCDNYTYSHCYVYSDYSTLIYFESHDKSVKINFNFDSTINGTFTIPATITGVWVTE